MPQQPLKARHVDFYSQIGQFIMVLKGHSSEENSTNYNNKLKGGPMRSEHMTLHQVSYQPMLFNKGTAIQGSVFI